jgi:hypothetical protein
MIKFEKGEFIGGDLMDVIHIDIDDDMDNLFDYQLNEECFILCVQDNGVKTVYFSVNHFGVDYIPRKEDVKNEFWDMFWDSDVTIVFGLKVFGLKEMQNYVGHCVEEVRTLAKEILSLDEFKRDWETCHFLSGNTTD